MTESARQPKTLSRKAERRGNTWSGVVALVLLAMFAVALIASELEAMDSDGAVSRHPIALIGQ